MGTCGICLNSSRHLTRTRRVLFPHSVMVGTFSCSGLSCWTPATYGSVQSCSRPYCTRLAGALRQGRLRMLAHAHAHAEMTFCFRCALAHCFVQRAACGRLLAWKRGSPKISWAKTQEGHA